MFDIPTTTSGHVVKWAHRIYGTDALGIPGATHSRRRFAAGKENALVSP